jgi:hypothetical protein
VGNPGSSQNCVFADAALSSYDSRDPLNLLTLTRRELDVYNEGRLDGYLEGEDVGYRRGYAACDEEIARLQRAAVAVVHRLARIPTHAEAQERRRNAESVAAARHARNAAPWPREAS